MESISSASSQPGIKGDLLTFDRRQTKITRDIDPNVEVRVELNLFRNTAKGWAGDCHVRRIKVFNSELPVWDLQLFYSAISVYNELTLGIWSRSQPEDAGWIRQ